MTSLIAVSKRPSSHPCSAWWMPVQRATEIGQIGSMPLLLRSTAVAAAASNEGRMCCVVASVIAAVSSAREPLAGIEVLFAALTSSAGHSWSQQCGTISAPKKTLQMLNAAIHAYYALTWKHTCFRSSPCSSDEPQHARQGLNISGRGTRFANVRSRWLAFS